MLGRRVSARDVRLAEFVRMPFGIGGFAEWERLMAEAFGVVWIEPLGLAEPGLDGGP